MTEWPRWDNRSVSMLEMLGWAGSAVLVLALLQARVLRFRIINLVGTLVLFSYQPSASC